MSRSLNITSIFVLALYILPLVQSIGTIGVYLNNISYISSKLCVNKDKPELHCDGTCVLAQMMNESGSFPVSPFENSENSTKLLETLAFGTVNNFEALANFQHTLKTKWLLTDHYKYVRSLKLDWPPELIVA